VYSPFKHFLTKKSIGKFSAITCCCGPKNTSAIVLGFCFKTQHQVIMPKARNNGSETTMWILFRGRKWVRDPSGSRTHWVRGPLGPRPKGLVLCSCKFTNVNLRKIYKILHLFSNRHNFNRLTFQASKFSPFLSLVPPIP
jgi:hypothetical protein